MWLQRGRAVQRPVRPVPACLLAEVIIRLRAARRESSHGSA
jgi:hypothetical protein